MAHSPRRPLMFHRLIRRWFGLKFDLTGLALSDDDVLLDLATGRE